MLVLLSICVLPSPSPIREMVTPMELQGTVAVVTGASSGIGRATALELARRGALVLGHACRSREAMEALVTEIRGLRRDAHFLMSDLRDTGAPDQLVDAAWNWKGRVDSWVNVAGLDILTGPMAQSSFHEKLTGLWQLDVCATVSLTRSVGQRMCQHEGSPKGCIINIGWDQAATGMAGESGQLFSAAKGAVMAFTLSAAKSLAPRVRVNCVAPGWIRTRWAESASAYWQARAVDESLLQRWGTPTDVAQTIAWLCSPQAEFVNGQVLHVNGGFRGTSSVGG